MINGKNNQPKKSFIIFFGITLMATISVVAANEHNTGKTNEPQDNQNEALKKSCHEQINKIRNISTGPSNSNNVATVQDAVDVYHALVKNNNICKFALEKKLRNLTKTLNDKITFYEKALLKKLGNEVSGIQEKKRTAENMFSILKEVIPTAELEEKIIVTFADYPAFSINLYGGIESQSVDKITSPDIPRLGLLVYQSNNNYRRKGFHIYGNFLLTGSAEATESTDNDPDQTLEMNFNVFYTLWENNLDDKYALIGPVISVGALRTSVKDEIYMPKKRYVGIRSALNPETYAEILFGTTSGLKSKRLELKLQAPIERFKNGSRIFVGAVFNMAYNKRIAGEPETASVYLSWHVPFGKLWNVNEAE